MNEVYEHILKTGIFTHRTIMEQLQNYYQDLNMHPMYFKSNDSKLISHHILELMMAQ